MHLPDTDKIQKIETDFAALSSALNELYDLDYGYPLQIGPAFIGLTNRDLYLFNIPFIRGISWNRLDPYTGRFYRVETRADHKYLIWSPGKDRKYDSAMASDDIAKVGMPGAVVP